MLTELRAASRFVRRLRPFLRAPWEPGRAVAAVRDRLNDREAGFLALVERGIFARPSSPYLRLMKAAGVELGDVRSLLRDEGLDGALGALYDAGVRVTLEEFKGRCPIRRAGLDVTVSDGDFDNPFARAHYEGRTGGSRGAGRRLIIDLDLLEYETAHVYLGLAAFDALDRPAVVWRPIPPGVTGMKEVLYRARLRRPPEHWFSQTRHGWTSDDRRYAGLTACATWGSRLWGKPIPRPRYVRIADTRVVIDWLLAKLEAGRAPLLEANVSTLVRVCVAARENGASIAGTLFRTGGEPFTPSRAKIVEDVGCRAACNYGISETGRLGIACARPAAPDDVHLLADKVAVLHRPKAIPGGPEVNALHVTTLHPSTPKLMLNVEIGDHAVRERRECGCALGEVGLTDHLHTIRSYEKLTSEGMHFTAHDVMELLEETLPRRFGGGPTDYQLVENEVDGLSRVSVLVHPRLGDVDPNAVVDAALRSLSGGGGGHAMMSRWWQEGGVLRVERREPHVTSAGKVLHLHVCKDAVRTGVDGG